MAEGYGRIESGNGGWIADGRGTGESRLRALVGEVEVRFDARHPLPKLPIVAGLAAADHACDAVPEAGGKRGGARRNLTDKRVGAETARAIADVGAQIESGPRPNRDEGILLGDVLNDGVAITRRRRDRCLFDGLA